jgi:DNA helicase IV
VYTETKPINIYDRDAVAAANAAATRSGTDEEVAEESPADRLPETLAEATAVIMAQFEEEQKQKAARAELEAANLEVERQIIEATPAVKEPAAAAPTQITTSAELADLKRQINDSLDEIANLLIGQQSMIEGILERLRLFNTRSGQKI